MDKFSNYYSSFKSQFTKGNFIECIPFLNICVGINQQLTLKKLYKSRRFFEKETLELLHSCDHLSKGLKILCEISLLNNQNIAAAVAFIKGASKKQLLQGCANILEKRNAEHKYNSSWNIKYANGNENYLETERQNQFFSSAGLEVQKLLDLFYWDAPEVDSRPIVWSAETEEHLNLLLQELGFHIELKDSLEKYLFFNGSIDDTNDKSIRLTPSDMKEGLIETDVINSLKSKEFTKSLAEFADLSLFNKYQKIHAEGQKKQVAQFEHQMKDEAYLRTFMMDIKVDRIVEREMVSFKNNYFPGLDSIDSIMLKDKNALKLEPLFRITGHLAERSKESITRMDETYKKAVNNYSKEFEDSSSWKNIQIESLLNKGDNEELKKVLQNNVDDQFFEQQQKVINCSKESIEEKDTLMSIDLNEFVREIQLVNQVSDDLILSVLELFTCKEGSDLTRTPFFKIGSRLYWFPNLVAHSLFSENLMEVLLSEEMVNVHLEQTKLFERSINKLFDACGYKIIKAKDENEEKQKKTFFSEEDGKPLGDLDILAYKDGKLIYMENKLTNTRNSYIERHNWKTTKLSEATVQLDTGLKYINKNVDKIKELLGLPWTKEIKEVETYIVSNSRLFDGEKFGDHFKINYQDLSILLLLSRIREENGHLPLDIFRILKENALFPQYAKTIRVADSNMIYDGYCIVRPGLISQNIYTSL